MVVALGVTSVLMVLMLQMFNDSSVIWKKSDERLDTFREARAALQVMAHDLGAINPLPGLPDQFPLLAFAKNPATADNATGNQEIYALASVPNSGKSDLCALGYFCIWNSQKNTFVLRRQLMNSTDTFTTLQKVLGSSNFIVGNKAFAALYARSSDTPNTDEKLVDVASYIWNLGFKIPGATPADPPFSPQLTAQQFYGSQPTSGSTGSTTTPTSTPNALPQWIEISFNALGSAAAHKLEGLSLTPDFWFTPNDPAYQRLILPNQQQFITRVKLTR